MVSVSDVEEKVGLLLEDSGEADLWAGGRELTSRSKQCKREGFATLCFQAPLALAVPNTQLWSKLSIIHRCNYDKSMHIRRMEGQVVAWRDG